MIKSTVIVGLLVLATQAMAQEAPPATWRDPDTRCVYLKVGDALSLRYRRDGTPDCASVQQDSTDASITRGDLRKRRNKSYARLRSYAGISPQCGEKWNVPAMNWKISVAKRGSPGRRSMCHVPLRADLYRGR